MKYPRVYHQFKKMLAVCHKQRHSCKDQEHMEALIGELEAACERIEWAHMRAEEADGYTGEIDDLADTEVVDDGCDEAEESYDEQEAA